MNIESNLQGDTNEKAEKSHAFDTGINIDDSQIIETYSADEKEYIQNNRNLFERFNEVRSRKEASDIIDEKRALDKEIRESTGRDSFEEKKAIRMYDFVKNKKEQYQRT